MDRMQAHWRLRQVMAERGMFQTTDLVVPLRSEGVELSREQVYRLVTGNPKRLNVDILAALCAILSCTPNDLLQMRREKADTTVEDRRSVGTLRPISARVQRPSA